MSEAHSGYETATLGIADQIGALRRRIFNWLLVEGMGRVLASSVAIFALDLLIDWTFRLDLAQRIIMLCLMLATIVAAIVYFVVRPLRHRLTDDALVLELERQTPETRNAVISAWQFSKAPDMRSQGISISLVEATIRLGSQAAETIDLGRLLNAQRFRLNSVLLVIALLVLLGGAVGVAANPVLGIWFNRNLLLGSKAWPQATYLIVEGLDEEGRLPMVRGEDYKLVVSIDPRSERNDVDVFFDYRDSGSRYRQKMRRTEQDGVVKFEHTFGTVVSEFRFQVFGGDARTDWIQVRLVEPPGLSELTLKAIPPAYTGLQPELLERGRSPYSVLRGSQLVLTAKGNKPLESARLRGPERDFEFELTGDRQLALTLSETELVEGKYVFDFLDQMGLTTKHPPGFIVRLVDDRAPRVRANTYGIGGLVVSRARIPLRISLEDEFAVEGVELEYQWKGDTSESIAQSATVPLEDANELLGEPRVTFTTVWELEPLEIPIGAGLVFSVAGFDNMTPEPNRGESKTFLLRVVSEAELRTDLLRREREQREDFERQITEQINLMTDLQALLAELRQADLADEDRTLDPVDTLASTRQRQRAMATVVSKIANRLEELLIEAENNRLDEESGRLRQRLSSQIIEPLRSLDLTELQQVERGLEAARLVLNQPGEAPEQVEQVVVTQQAVIAKMKQILTYMVKAEGYQEAINLLREIEKTQQNVLQMTDEQRRKRIQSIFEGDEKDN